ncbi:murein transglycosylase A [Pseudokordiimonas caeni]|uniref:murein transglycosylase A n=1 Tax=Pseudokordiimonas caeni TaxID=2997908 RepID=UPI002811C978|nr:MltA domain-containing protein [Pseudokordiimonas caeni]
MAGRFLKLLAFLALVALPLALAFFLRPPERGLRFAPVSYSDLPGWDTDPTADAWPALSESCKRILTLPDSRAIPGAAIGGTAADWKPVCGALLTLEGANTETLRVFIEANFTPYAVTLAGNPTGLFTGYHEAFLKGSETPSETYNVPLYVRPPELVMVNLGLFRDSLKGERIAGEVKDGQLVPYASHADINKGALNGRGLELLWVDDAVEAFNLHIQGSGRVQMPDGSIRKVGYAAQNGHPYVAIGRILIERGEIPREKMSMPAIKDWLRTHPDEAAGVMEANPSFVFFRDLPVDQEPLGAAGVPLTGGRSLAVDRSHLPLHAPVFLSASQPNPKAPSESLPLNRLMVAQDTGGAIRGEIRGDVYWGFGEDATTIAGHMAAKGRFWLLLPNGIGPDAGRS